MAEPKPHTDFLAGGGEMGELIRGFDWSSTPLGSIALWPQSMRLTVGLCVKSRFPIIIHWGWPALTVLYNDAFIPFAGEKHPTLLGRPLFESWPELQPTLGPMLESVLTTGKAALSDDLLLVYDRRGYLEETYYTLSFNPIVLESGKVGGSFSLIDYTTDRVIGERRMRTLRDLAARTGEAKEIDESYRVAAEVLAGNPQDIPFALLYVVDGSRKQARLVAAAGLEKGVLASPPVVDLTAEQNPSGWPFGRVADTALAERVDALEKKFGPLPGGAWPVSPQTAMVLPITLPGHEVPSGLLVAAVNPRKALDDSYRAFFNSVTRQVAASLVGALAYQGLVELDRAKTTFFSNVSHEFRTPLTLLIGPLEELLASKGSSMSAQHRSALELAVRNGLRLQKLVNSLLDFSRIEAHRVQATYQATDLAALTSSLASVFRSAIEKAGMSLNVDCPRLPELTYVDHEMWEKIVLNLLSNAFKYTFEGEIRIGLRQVGDTIELSVSDAGVGIPEDELPRIFERFHRVEGIHGRTIEGTGIGLALVQELVKLHGGTIRADSTVGKGSVFTVSIPMGKDHLPIKSLGSGENLKPAARGARAFVEEALRWLPEASTGTNSIESPALGSEDIGHLSVPDFKTELQSGKARILMADDNADMRNYVRVLLSDRCEVATVADGEAALAKLRQSPPDLVLADVMMPRLDGFGLLKAIRSDPAISTIPVILLSARAGDESKVEGLEHGADDYIAKPFSGRELVARVAAHVAVARLRKEASERQAQEKHAADLRLVVDTVPGFVWTTTAAGEVELVNRQMLEYFGKSLVEFKGWTTSDAIHPDDLQRAVAAWNDAVKTGEPYDVDHRLRRADGGYRWFHSRGLPLRDAGGRIIRWYNLLTDIDDRKQAEERLLLTEAYLSEAQTLSRTGSFGWDIASGEIYWSPESFRIFEYEPASSVTIEQILQRVHPEDRSVVERVVERASREKTQFDFEHRIVMPDGSIKYLRVRGQPSVDDSGRLEMVGAVTDITEHVQQTAKLEKAFEEIKRLKDRLQDENVALREQIDQAFMFEEIVGSSKALRSILAQVAKVAPTDSTVLITGETGTGKELVARAIHRRSNRSDGAFVCVNCAAIPQSLIASELFGHEKGAFTGAIQRRLGRFELANRGTIFLDEVGELPAETQVALLRVLQEREIERIGGQQRIPVDVRVLAATNRDLRALIKAGGFRQDLFYRLNVFPIPVPSLRERIEDIPLLVEYLIQRYAKKAGKRISNIDKHTMALLRNYDWPGNVRELQNVIERAVILASDDTFRLDETWLKVEIPPGPDQSAATEKTLGRRDVNREREIIEAALAESGGRIAGPRGAAAKLGIPRQTLDSKIRSLGINKNRFKSM